uniref:Transposase n=1 Tax=Steinernema glaseri TaxID=37863 RepID=A0A1I8A5G3_9BILA
MAIRDCKSQSASYFCREAQKSPYANAYGDSRIREWQLTQAISNLRSLEQEGRPHVDNFAVHPLLLSATRKRERTALNHHPPGIYTDNWVDG